MHVLMSVTSNPLRKTDNLIPSSIFTIVLSVNNFAPMHVISKEAGAVRRHGETPSFILHQYSLDLFLFVFLQAPSCFWTSFESFIPIAFLHRPWGKSQAFACYLSPAFPSSSSIVLGGKSQAFACHLSLLGYCKVLKVGKKNITNQAGFMLKNDHMKN